MKGLIVACHGSTETRYRSAGADDDTGKRKPPKYKVLREDKYKFLFSERSSSCKFESLKLALFIITCCTVLTLAFCPMIHKERVLSRSGSRSLFVDVARMWQTMLADPRYVSNLDVVWDQIPSFLKYVNADGGSPRIGLLNFNSTEARLWRQTLPQAEVSSVHLDYAETSITWKVLYPEWIDEQEENEVPACPSLPEPEIEEGSRFDLVAVKLPCDRSGSWSRDVARLHLQLAAAKIAAASAAGHSQVHVLIVTDCMPFPNLFTCKNLVQHEGNLWLYKPDSATLEEKLRLPIGSCELAIPFEAKVRMYTEFGRREAYVTILHSAKQYVCGAIAAARSIRLAGSARDLVILVDEAVSEQDRNGLEAAGWKVRVIERIRNPKAKRDAYNEWNYSKFRLWQLTDYDKVIFIDADLLVLRNIDFLFAMPEISAIGNNGSLFNSGVMVIEPSNCTFQLLMDHIDDITSYNGGDQGYLNEIFTWWHRTPRHTNFLKHFWVGDSEERKKKKDGTFGADPPVLYVIHYLGLKPWLCFRDYDCNWNSQKFWGFASDAAHATWWRVHDTLPEDLQNLCLLSTKRKAFLEYSRRKAEKANYPDGHWRRNITDPRSEICSEAFCNWESMLLHWGEKMPSNNSHASVGGTAAAPSS
ncbi:putative UDP-glucuronate:xylan alpha-glucuronosyltransferase 3 [Musa acuminata AAA Group]|uniref:putative UDP-glucuronate:xylan alpha-glucuronosyltransferase 3 n=1 Tax=Musa acuminata AAA Group TaxID=214697 RepID=UPI0031DF72DD